MLLMNPCTHDTRVMKEATSLTKNGYEVHIVALLKPNLETEETIDGVTIHRVKPAFVRLWSVCRVLPMLLFPIGAIPNIRFTKHVARRGGIPADNRNNQSIMYTCVLFPFKTIGFVFALFLSGCFYVFIVQIRFLCGLFSKHENLKALLYSTKIYIQQLSKHIRAMFMIRANRLQNILLVKLPYSFRIHSINFDLCERALLLKPDIIQSHDCNTILGGAMTKKKLSIPLVYDSHELYLERNIGERSRWWDKKQWAPIEKKVHQIL